MQSKNNSVIKTTAQILKDNICTLFNLLNLIIAVSLAIVGAWRNMLFFLVIVLNTVIGIVQEIKAKKQIEKLTLLSLPVITVLRDGQELHIPPDEVKMGDIMELISGAVVCCDCIIRSGSAEINEAVLTGESEPVLKQRGDKLLAGSTVISGKCTAETVCESSDSFTSKITDAVKKTGQSGSELLMSMKKVTRFTSFLIIPLGILLFVQGFFLRGGSVEATVVSASAALLGMLPKGLVLLISIGLAAGVVNLSKKRVLVRELHSLENLAHCDIVCFDKTGTLTEGKLTVEYVFADIDSNEFERLMAAYLKYTSDNNSTYTALKDCFKQSGSTYECISAEPFSSERKYSAVTKKDGETFIIGAPERLCRDIPQSAAEFMSRGSRVILAGLCRGEVQPENIRVIGMIVISDKVRKNAPETVGYFYAQGIDVKVISGDNPITAAAVAKKAGIKNSDKYIDMSKAADENPEDVASRYTVFGRVTPEQKKQLVSAMQKQGHKVAMTGDGVNDLMAMRRSDCSIAMGNGTDAAKQTAQLVLLNSDFSVLRDVISEGRRVINNLTKSAGVFFIKTIYSVLLSILCLVLNCDFPFIPVQITLIDAVIEAFPAFFMSFERNDKKVEGSFLNTAVRAALPNAAAIFLCCCAVLLASPHIGIDSAQYSLLMYLTVGFVSLAGVIKASRPLNRLRGFLSAASVLGFAGAVVVFKELLQLPALSHESALVLPFVLALGVILAAAIRIPDRKKMPVLKTAEKACLSSRIKGQTGSGR